MTELLSHALRALRDECSAFGAVGARLAAKKLNPLILRCEALEQRADTFERTAVILADENERLMTYNANLKKVLYGAGPDETAIVQAMIDEKPNK
jgi:hypothetical protein